MQKNQVEQKIQIKQIQYKKLTGKKINFMNLKILKIVLVLSFSIYLDNYS